MRPAPGPITLTCHPSSLQGKLYSPGLNNTQSMTVPHVTNLPRDVETRTPCVLRAIRHQEKLESVTQDKKKRKGHLVLRQIFFPKKGYHGATG